MTVYRARQELCYEEPDDRSISDADIQQILVTIKAEKPNVGEKVLHGILKSKGIRITRRKLQLAVHAVDPLVASYPGSWWAGERESLVSTVCACA